MQMTICRRVHYWGKVQGVGFRYATARMAREHPVTGYVRNLLDGQVEIIVEGAPQHVDQFLAAVARQMTDFIRGTSVHEEMPQGFEGFTIRS